MAIWWPGSGLRFQQYLQVDSFVKDITRPINQSADTLGSQLSRQTKEIVASREQLADEFNSLNDTLESLAADFNYNMGLLIDQVSVTNDLLSNLIDKLDAVHKTLESPILTQAREYYRIGCDRLSKGLLDKALEAFLESERKNDADFFTQFHIGNLYLYGIDEDDNVINLIKAKEHLLLAARYAKAEIKVDASFVRLTAEALLHASIAVYAQLGEKGILDDTSKIRSLLEEAKRLASDAVKIYPQLSESYYHLAKYSALLKEPELSTQNLQTAIIANRNYAIKVDVDHAFDPIRNNVIELLSRMRDDKEAECRSKLHQAEIILQDVSEWHVQDELYPFLANSSYSQFENCKQTLEKAYELFKCQNYFGFLDAIQLLDSLIITLPQIKHARINELSITFEKSIASARNLLHKTCEYTYEEKIEL